jgi:hypothetical protein
MSGMTNIIWISCVWFLATTAKTTSAFSSPASNNKPFSLDVSRAFQNVLDLFSPQSADMNKTKREQLKNNLLTKCRESESSSIEETRGVIESLISELATLTPNPAAAESILLQKAWQVYVALISREDRILSQDGPRHLC